MGQRHQLFIIAKINARYRVLAVVHNQWLCGIDALEVCLRLIKTFEEPENHLALSHELRWAKTLSEDTWQSKDEGLMPFPFVHTCLSTGASYDPHPEKPYYHKIRPLPFNLNYNGGDNNDGITVLDITNLRKVQYTFVDFKGRMEEVYWYGDDGKSDESGRVLELDIMKGLIPTNRKIVEDIFSDYRMRPLSAGEYLWSYNYQTPELFKKDHFLGVLKDFEYRPLIHANILDSVWPNAGWRESKPAKESIENVSVTSSTLRSTAMTILIDEALSSPVEELPKILESAKLLTDFWPVMRAKLYAEPEGVSRSPAAMKLLSFVIEHDSVVDLSPFQLPPEEIRQTLLDSNLDNVKTLSLSGNGYIDENTLKDILTKHPALECLHLLNTPQLELKIKLDLARRFNLSEMLDTELLSLPFDETPKIADPESYCYVQPLVVQMMVVKVDRMTREEPRLPRTSDGGLFIENITTTQNTSRAVSLPFPFSNTNTAPHRLLSGISKSIRFLALSSLVLREPITDLGRILALSCATALQFDEGPAYKAGALSETLYRRIDSRQELFLLQRQASPRPKVIAPEEWSLLFIMEGFMRFYPNAVRYAFISATSVDGAGGSDETGPKTKIIRADFETFLHHTIKGERAEETRELILGGWKRALDNLDPEDPEFRLEVCGMEEIESYLRSENYTGLKKDGTSVSLDD